MKGCNYLMNVICQVDVFMMMIGFISIVYYLLFCDFIFFYWGVNYFMYQLYGGILWVGCFESVGIIFYVMFILKGKGKVKMFGWE